MLKPLPRTPQNECRRLCGDSRGRYLLAKAKLSGLRTGAASGFHLPPLLRRNLFFVNTQGQKRRARANEKIKVGCSSHQATSDKETGNGRASSKHSEERRIVSAVDKSICQQGGHKALYRARADKACRGST
jgi:hypothetical protein